MHSLDQHAPGARTGPSPRPRASAAGLRRSLALFVLLGALMLAGCEQVSDLIPGDGSDFEGQNGEATPGPDATPMLPSADDDNGPAVPPAGSIPDHELARVVVQVQVMDGDDIIRAGSGVIIDASERLILTSHELVQPNQADGSRAYSSLAIGRSGQIGDDPEQLYEAEIAAADPRSQLAVLRVVERTDGGSLDDEDGFPGVEAFLGEVSDVSAGHAIRIFGHPADEAGNNTRPVAMTNAGVTGFRADAATEDRTWIKTDARLPHGLAGGPVFDEQGILIGVLVQESHLPSGEVSHARPIDLAADVIERARSQAAGEPVPDLVHLSHHIPGTDRPRIDDGIWASRPQFALDATETAAGRDLFDYTYAAPGGIDAIYYEFVLAGIENGEAVEERWFLDGMQQDSLSSSYSWDRGRFGLVSDRIFTPSESGLPDGQWRVEIWIEDELRSAATVLVGVPGRDPEIGNIERGSLAEEDEATPAEEVAPGADQLLAFLDFAGFDSVTHVHWVVRHEDEVRYEAPAMLWPYGDSGRTWIGFRDGEGIAEGVWEFELFADGESVNTIRIRVSAD